MPEFEPTASIERWNRICIWRTGQGRKPRERWRESASPDAAARRRHPKTSQIELDTQDSRFSRKGGERTIGRPGSLSGDNRRASLTNFEWSSMVHSANIWKIAKCRRDNNGWRGQNSPTRVSFPETWITSTDSPEITKLVIENPKSGKSHDRFALYWDGMTVAEYISAVVANGDNERHALDDLCWDINHLFIRLDEPSKAWSVADAKAKLSEILRLARAGQPQTIGTEEPCVVVSATQFEQHFESEHLGRFLIDSAPRGCELELPSRADHRGDPFAPDEDGRAA